MLVYFAIGLVGFLLLVVSFVVGELDDLISIDLFDSTDGVGPFNSKVITASLTAFGAAGMLTTYYGWGPMPSALGAGAVALGVGGTAWWLLGMIYRQEASSETTMSSLRGRLGEVTTAIPEGGLGQVLFVGSGSSRQMLARTQDGSALPAGRTVRILQTLGSTLIVEAVPVPDSATSTTIEASQ